MPSEAANRHSHLHDSVLLSTLRRLAYLLGPGYSSGDEEEACRFGNVVREKIEGVEAVAVEF